MIAKMEIEYNMDKLSTCRSHNWNDAHQSRAQSLPVCEEECRPTVFCVLSLLRGVYSDVHKPQHLKYRKEKEKKCLKRGEENFSHTVNCRL